MAAPDIYYELQKLNLLNLLLFFSGFKNLGAENQMSFI